MSSSERPRRKKTAAPRAVRRRQRRAVTAPLFAVLALILSWIGSRASDLHALLGLMEHVAKLVSGH